MTRTTGVAALLAAFLASEAQPADLRAYHRTEYVMGTMLSLELEAPDSVRGAGALDTAFRLAHKLDHLLSNYLPESEISQIGARAPAAVKVQSATFDFLARTLSWSRRSGGALNPTIGPLVEGWGFHTETPSFPDSQVVANLRLACDYRRIHMDSQTLSVSVNAGMKIDPGATGKGYALRAIDSALAVLGITTLRADFGGQVFSRGLDSLLVPVRHPRNDSAALAWVLMDRGSVSTSGDYDRFFEQDGVRYAHILDPRTGFPVQGRAAVSVYAPDPFDADALSTALFVLGPEKALPLLRQAGAGALFAEWVGDSLDLIIVGAWPQAP